MEKKIKTKEIITNKIVGKIKKNTWSHVNGKGSHPKYATRSNLKASKGGGTRAWRSDRPKTTRTFRTINSQIAPDTNKIIAMVCVCVWFRTTHVDRCSIHWPDSKADRSSCRSTQTCSHYAPPSHTEGSTRRGPDAERNCVVDRGIPP